MEREVEYTAQFKRDHKREKKGQFRKTIEQDLQYVVDLLAFDKVLPQKYSDHSLVGTWKDCRDCHLKPDLILIYRKPNKSVLELVRLGSHSELGL